MSDPTEIEDREHLREELVRVEQMLEAERKRRGDAEAMIEGLRRVASAGSPDRMDAELLAALQSVTQCREAALLVEDGDDLAARLATSPALDGARWPRGALFGRVLAGQPVAIFDVRDVPEWAAQPEAIRALTCSALHVPLVTHHRTAMLVAVHEARSFFSPRHVELGRRFAQMVVPLLDGADAKEVERERSAAVERAAALEEKRAALEAQLETIMRQQEEIERLVAPAIPLWPGIVMVPIVGSFTAEQAQGATERVLRAMADERAQEVVIDVTGLDDFDEALGGRLGALLGAVRLMGGHGRLSGLGARAATALVDLGGRPFATSLTLRDALVEALGHLGMEVRRKRRET